MNNIAQYIEHTNLKPDAVPTDIRMLCLEAKDHGFYGVCINPRYVELARTEMGSAECKVISVVGFPLGANSTATKVYEATDAINYGADEIDMVMAIGALKSNNYAYVESDIRAVVTASDGKPVKVIIETALLNDEEKRRAINIVMNAGASFVKTSTGFASAGATVEDVMLMREIVSDKLGVKAAGGIRDYDTAKAMIEAGASRLGCSASLAIISDGGIERAYEQ